MYQTVVPGVTSFALRQLDGSVLDIGDYLELRVDTIRIDGWHQCTMLLSSENTTFAFRAKLGEVRNGTTYAWVLDGMNKPRLVELKRRRSK